MAQRRVLLRIDMTFRVHISIFCAAFWFLLAGFVVSVGTVFAADAGPSYDKDVRPILSQYCFKCHGPDDGQRQAGLRLDTSAGATVVLESGKRAIVPGKSSESELLRRVVSDDPDERMPPVSTKFVLTDAQKDTLKTWVAAGAEYKAHWAFVPPRRPVIPTLRIDPVQRATDSAILNPSFDAHNPAVPVPVSPIDAFIVDRLRAANLDQSPAADKYALIRRASLDLIGLPPTIAETDQFVGDKSPDAYERLLDRLLASPHYGERWGRKWLDLARYADTNGYEKDRSRTVWPYRDWVINAINADLPYDQFTIEQLAGDMRPDATVDQRIATGFHRNTMLNEEGGIDPLEFRFYAMTDRVATTATTWLGLTLGCAQCHTHKYDPITHRDYYSFFALLNNADEPEMEIVRPEQVAQRADLERRIEQLEAELPNRFPLPDDYEWRVAQPVSVTSTKSAKMQILDDAAVVVSGETPETDAYEIQINSDFGNVTAIRLEALIDPSLPSKGPGRTPHGNFVLSEITATVASGEKPADSKRLKFARATADFSQNLFPIEKAIDGDATAKSGWAIDTGMGNLNVDRTATFVLSESAGTESSPSKWTIRLEQHYGGKHTLGKFRISLGRMRSDKTVPEAQRRLAHLEQKFGEWRRRERERIVKWMTVAPVAATSNMALLTVLDDSSVIASGDQSKRDVYEIGLANLLANVTALRIEALPDTSLPKNGPGRIYYEGPFGDFFLSEVSLSADQRPVKLVHPSHSFAAGQGAPACLDGNPQTGWSIDGGQGKPHVAVFRFEKPLERAKRLDLTLLFERYYACGLGRFRVSVTDDPRPVEATSVPTNLEPLILQESNDAAAKAMLIRYYCSIAPEMANERKPIEQLRRQLAAVATALVMKERPANNPRITRRHHRGEFLQPKEIVEPTGLSMLPPLRSDRPATRLGLAEWLVGPDNPLAGRVTVNRHWATLFGRGIVKTTEDFGSQGASPTHPELLDWLALELAGDGEASVQRPTRWSIKRLHRLLTSSGTYRQSSRVSPESLEKDPGNELLGRGPRFRMEAELVRDSALRISGLLSEKIGGPSVFPPQPASVTTEGTYGSLAWTVSPGEDKYRRSLYTFSKRTSPYAMFMTFDGPSGEACIARREVTNTPLQALTMLNDTVMIEAAQSVGREFASRSDPERQRLSDLFRHCVTRPAADDELGLLQRYLKDQAGRLDRNELDVNLIAGPGDNAKSRAAWTLVARSLLNLDEAITK